MEYKIFLTTLALWWLFRGLDSNTLGTNKFYGGSCVFFGLSTFFNFFYIVWSF